MVVRTIISCERCKLIGAGSIETLQAVLMQLSAWVIRSHTFFSENARRKALAEFYSALRHDGILILDQRNYDTILDEGFSSKHTYYYCGEKVKAEPEHVDGGLARFRYEFPDGSKYNLNMFPLRKNYVTNLMSEVGFQNVTTYGDFQETYKQDSPDFFIHVAEKEYSAEDDN